ncbi:conserved hypothetical protein [Magnetospirillum sp. UT-4]|nr:conserved hypothetical protein [Magnetospirillum sp. UT-4]
MAFRILHVANFAHRTKGAGFAGVQFKLTNGLIRAGHHVLAFSDRDAARAATPFRSRKVGTRGANRALLDVAAAFRPDIVLFGHADTIAAETLGQIRQLVPGVRLAQWNVDPLFDVENLTRIRAKLGDVDWTFVSTAGPMLSSLAGRRVAFLPNPVDPSIERGRGFEARDRPYDVFYAVGSAAIGRNHCGIDSTAAAIAGRLRTRLAGVSFLLPGIEGPHVEGADFDAAMVSAKMGLNISRRNDVPLYSSDRFAHLAGNGLLVFIDRATGYGDLFGEDELAFYSTEDELAAKIQRFAGDDPARMRMAHRGWLAYHAMFGATRVARYMLEVMEERADPSAFAWRPEGRVVPQAGLEPASLAAVDFESTASTNSATGAPGGSEAGV